MTKVLWKINHKGGVAALKESEKASTWQSAYIFFGMIFGAVLGAFTYHQTDLWLFTPVSVALFVALFLHDRYLPAPAGWGELHEPLMAGMAAVPAAAK